MVAVAMGGVVVGDRGGLTGAVGRRELTPGEVARRAGVVGRLLRPRVVEEDERSREGRRRGVAEAFAPAGGWGEWLCGRVATLIARVDRAERVEVALRDRAAYRAFDFWEEDQALAAEELASRLKRDPARTVLKLRRTPAGLDWLAARWRMLARLGPEGWRDEHRELAARLLGGDDSVDPTAPGFASAQVEAIEAARPRIQEDDALRRGLVEADLSDKDVPDRARLRRQVRQWQREIQWCVAQLEAARTGRDAAPIASPSSNAEMKPSATKVERAIGETKPSFVSDRTRFDEMEPPRPVAAGASPGRGGPWMGDSAPIWAARPGVEPGRGGPGAGRRP